jgi:hypothetical protein
MNQELMDMARKAGITMSSQYGAQWEANTEDLEAFAALVEAAEREACAKVCEEWGGFKDGYSCATIIRARGETE